MKTNNGKLLGQPKSDLDLFKQQLEQLVREVDEVQASFQELGQKIEQTEEVKREALVRRVELYVQHLKEHCETSEVLLAQRQENQAKTYQGELKKIELLLREQEKRLESLEITKLNQIENNLTHLKKQIPTKLLWLTFSSSLTIAIISFCAWFEIYPFNNRPEKTKYSLDRHEFIEDRHRLKCQANCFESNAQIDFRAITIASVINK